MFTDRLIANCRHIDKYKHLKSAYVIRAFVSDEKRKSFSPVWFPPLF